MPILEKVLCSLLLLTLFATPIFAVEKPGSSSTSGAYDSRKEISGLAALIMQLRQANAPMSRMIEIALTEEDKTTREIGVEMVKLAYEQDAYSTEKYQQEAIREFENTWNRVCIKRLTK